MFDEVTTPFFELETADALDDQAYLLVFERESSRMFSLPRQGEIVIGRTEAADLMLQDNAVSRNHARISISGGDVRVLDLGSQNGTRVNGERITGPRTLVSHDVITVCNTQIVFRASGRPSKRTALDLPHLRRRGEEELDRALRYQRTFSLLVCALEQKPHDPEAIVRGLGKHLRLIDVLGWGAPDQVVVLMPETDPVGAESVAERIILQLFAELPNTRIGIASCPGNGCSIDALLSSARDAAQNAEPGKIASAQATFRKLSIGGHPVVVGDAAMTRLYALIERLAACDLPVLIHGETGTGKELAANAVHHWSKRKGAPLIAINCAALPENLVESELFGHERGAFTGATSAKVGAFESASGGTVFLDEIGELPLGMQAKLLRALESKKITRVGDAARERDVDVRFVAATNRDLKAEVKAGRFREDLFFRLNVATVWIPPLRDRNRELPVLAQALLQDACERAGRASSIEISDAAMQLLATYAWPGNVRELKNVMNYAAATVSGPLLEPSHISDRLASGSIRGVLPPARSPANKGEHSFRPIGEEIRELERTRISEALAACGGNQTRAAELIGMPLRTFVWKLKQYNLRDDVQNRP